MMMSLMDAYLDAVANVNAWCLEDMLVFEARKPHEFLKLTILEMARDQAQAALMKALEREQ